MTISGFTMIRNAVNYDFPVVECITSLLDLVDELVIALGDSSDQTEEIVNSIQSDKIKIIKTNWDSSKYNKDGQVYANQTDIALKACTGDWCIYLQADEVLHETAVPIIREACQKYLNVPQVEGFLLRYVHLYADHQHYIHARHFGYPKEVRIVRNLPRYSLVEGCTVIPPYARFRLPKLLAKGKHPRIEMYFIEKRFYLPLRLEP